MRSDFFLSIKAIAFDFDGVILESAGIKTEAFRELFSDSHYVDAIVAYHEAHAGESRYEKFRYIYRNFFNRPLEKEEEANLGERFSDLCYAKVLKAPLIHGVKDFLMDYHRQYFLFVASGTPQQELLKIMEARDLSAYFQKVYGSPLKKSEIIHKILNQYHLLPQEILFIGDSLTDFTEAHKVGVPFIGRISRKQNPFSGLEIQGTIHNFQELNQQLIRTHHENSIIN